MKKYRRKRIFAGLLVLFLGIICMMEGVCHNVYAISNSNKKTLLIILEENIKLEEEKINVPSNVTYDLVYINNLSDINWGKYAEIVAPSTTNKEMNEILREQYECGQKIYLYGEITIHEYCEILGMDDFVVEAKLESTTNDAENNKTIKYTFDEEYINSEVKNIVALKKDSSDGMVAKIAKNEEGNYEIETFFNIIMDRIEISSSTRGVVPVTQQFDFIASAPGGEYVLLDWYLSKYSSVVNGYSYYAVRTNVQAFGTTTSGLQYLAKGIYVNMSCPLTNDQLKDCGPASTENQSNIQVGLEFGEEISASISWSMNLTSKPDITCIENMSTDTVSWEVEKLNSNYNLNNQIFKPGMTWLTPTKTAALDIQFRGYFESNVKGLWTYTDWENVYIRAWETT